MKTHPSHLLPLLAKKFGLVLVSLTAIVLWGATHKASAQSYTITDLGTLGGTNSFAYGINNFGQVVGFAYNGQNYKLQTCFKCSSGEFCGPGRNGCYQNSLSEFRAFLWTPAIRNGINGNLIDLGTFSGPNSQAYRNNASGQIIGSANTNHKLTEVYSDGCCDYKAEAYESKSFLWTPRGSNGVSGSMSDLGDFYAAGINAAGDLVGGRYLWHNGTVTDLGTLVAGGGTHASDINDLEQVVGWSLTDGSGTWHPFLWRNGVMTDLGTADDDTYNPLFYNISINTNGQVVGTSGAGPFFTSPHNFLFTLDSTGTVISRERLGDLPGGTSWPAAINNKGQVVGTAYTNNQSGTVLPIGPFLWDSAHGMRNLNTLAPGSGWTLLYGKGINDVGQIVGSGVNPSGQTHAFLLTPIPTPRLNDTSIQSNGQFRCTLIGQAGRSYTIQASTNLVNWTAVTNFVSATGTNQFIDSTAPNFSRRFYRALTP